MARGILELLQYAVSKNASDLHLSAGVVPCIRFDGELENIEGESALDEAAIYKMLAEICPERHRASLTSKTEIDLAVSASGGRFRVNIFKQNRGPGAAFRFIPKDIPSFDALDLTNIAPKLCSLPHGLILVTGPTGSGKTTTIASMISYINEHNASHIVTIEDPIEYIHDCKKCLVDQREVGLHTASFSDALRAVLREDPDFIFVGEMRDLETIRLALTAAETGHLVFATLHTNSAAETINRIIDVFPASEKDMVRSLLSSSLRAVISQILLKKKSGGRIAAREIMLCTMAIKNLIRENKVHQIYSVIQTGQEKGMQTLEQHLQLLKKQNLLAGSDINAAGFE